MLYYTKSPHIKPYRILYTRADIHTHIPHYTHIHTQAQNTYLDMHILYYKKVRVAYIQNTQTHIITLRLHITLHILYNTAYQTYPTHACTTHIPRNTCILLYILRIAHWPESTGKFITHTYTQYTLIHLRTYTHICTYIYTHTRTHTHTPNWQSHNAHYITLFFLVAVWSMGSYSFLSPVFMFMMLPPPFL